MKYISILKARFKTLNSKFAHVDDGKFIFGQQYFSYLKIVV